MRIIDNNNYETKEKELVLVNRLSKLPVGVIDAEANAHDDILEDAGQVKCSISGAGDALGVTSVAGVGHRGVTLDEAVGVLHELSRHKYYHLEGRLDNNCQGDREQERCFK